MDMLISHLRSLWPWLEGVTLHDQDQVFEPSAWLRVCLSAVRASEQKPVVLVVPTLGNLGRWTALLYALESVRSGFDQRVALLQGGRPEPGQRVVIKPENRCYIYRGTTGAGLTVLECADGSGRQNIQLSPLRIQVQPTGGVEGRMNSLKRNPPSHLFSEILGCDPMGNHEALGHGLVLIDSKGGASDFASSAFISKAGKLGAFNEYGQTGRLWTIHRSALDFIDTNPQGKKTVIVNGAHRLKTLAELHRLQHHHLVVFAEPTELEQIKGLEGQADFWFADSDPWLATGTDAMSVRIANLSTRDWSPRLVENPEVEKAASSLGRFCGLLYETEPSPAQSLAGPAWGLLLDLSGRTRGFSDKQRRTFESQVAQFRKFVEKTRQSLTQEMEAAVNEALDLIGKVAGNQPGATSPKGAALHELSLREGNHVFVTRSENEAKSLRTRFPQATVLTQTDLPPTGRGFELIIVCGWLGAYRMSQLLSSGAARRIVLTGYGFEIAWLRSLAAKLARRGGIVECDRENKLEIVEGNDNSAAWPQAAPTPEINWPLSSSASFSSDEIPAQGSNWIGIDVWRFEHRLKSQRKEPKPVEGAATQEQDFTDVRYVSFTGTGYAFFTTDRKVLVISDLLKDGEQAIKPLRVEKLKQGDLVVFPYLAGSDLISQVADTLLGARSDRLRNIAKQYHLKLRAGNLRPEEFLREAKRHGLNRSLGAVRDWFAGNLVIGPDSDDDIKVIQKVVGGTNWADQCIQAIHELRSVHSSAESRVRTALLQQLGQHFDEIETCGCHLELGEIGSVWVQFVDSIAEAEERQPRRKANLLLGVS
jgi:hypothetical protein